MPINRRMDKEVVVHIYNGLLLSHKKKRNLVICSEVDGPRVCHIERSKFRKRKTNNRMLTYIWNLKKINGSDESRGRIGIKTQT